MAVSVATDWKFANRECSLTAFSATDPFDAKVKKTCYHHDDGAYNDMEHVLEPLIEDIAGDVVEDALKDL